jgi:hypothetical protein
MFPYNNNYFYSTIYFFGAKADINIAKQMPDENFSHVINTGIVPHWDKSFKEEVKQTPIYNMSNSFNEVSMEWTDEKIIWKLNDQHINYVEFNQISSGNKNIEQIFNNNFTLVMALTLKQEFYKDSNFNLKNIQKPYLYIDYIRIYKWKETEFNTQSYPVTNNTMTTVINPFSNNSVTTVVNPVANNTMTSVVSSFENNTKTIVVNPVANNTMTSVVNSFENNTKTIVVNPISNNTITKDANLFSKNSVTTIIIPVLLVILVVLIIIAIVYSKLKVKHEINYSVLYNT